MFTVRVCNVADGRAAYARLQRLLAMMAEEELAKTDAVLLAGLGGLLTEEDLTFYCNVFEKYTTVDMGDGRTLPLLKNMDQVFSGEIENLLEWIKFCIEVNFSGVIVKMKAALAGVVEQVAAKQQTSG